MFHHLWKTIRNVLLAVGAVFSLFLVLELVRALLFLKRLHPVAPIIVAAALAPIGLWLMIKAFRWWRFPRVHEPPPLPPLNEANHSELRTYCQYLLAYLTHLSENPNLEPQEIQAIREQIEYVRDTLRHHPLNEDLRLAIHKTEEGVIRPVLNRLGELAARVVRDGVRDVMIAVMVSPYPSLDLLIVLYRNLSMVSRVMEIYRTRPSAREQWRMLRDIATVVATVNFINLNRKLIEALGSQLPVVGKIVDTLVQGIGAGIFTSIAGHAAIARCAAHSRWDQETAARSLVAQSAQFLRDVRLILTRDLLPELRSFFRTGVPSAEADQPGFWEKIEEGIRLGVDATARSFEAFVIRPALAGAQGVASATATVARGFVRGSHRAWQHIADGGARAFRSVRRAFVTFAERVRYGILGRWLR